MVSAIKVAGERLYAKARRGEEVERAPADRGPRAGAARLHPGERPQARISVVCSGGTYVRSLAADLGRASAPWPTWPACGARPSAGSPRPRPTPLRSWPSRGAAGGGRARPGGGDGLDDLGPDPSRGGPPGQRRPLTATGCRPGGRRRPRRAPGRRHPGQRRPGPPQGGAGMTSTTRRGGPGRLGPDGGHRGDVRRGPPRAPGAARPGGGRGGGQGRGRGRGHLRPAPAGRAAPGSEPPLLTTLDRKVELLGEAGMAVVLVLQFTRELSEVPAEAFAAEVLFGAWPPGRWWGRTSASVTRRPATRPCWPSSAGPRGIEVVAMPCTPRATRSCPRPGSGPSWQPAMAAAAASLGRPTPSRGRWSSATAAAALCWASPLPTWMPDGTRHPRRRRLRRPPRRRHRWEVGRPRSVSAPTPSSAPTGGSRPTCSTSTATCTATGSRSTSPTTSAARPPSPTSRRWPPRSMPTADQARRLLSSPPGGTVRTGGFSRPTP